MSFRYTHTLIPTSKETIPTSEQIQTFLAAMIECGAIGGKPAFNLRTPSKRTRQGRNPFTGENIVLKISNHAALSRVDLVAKKISKLKEFHVSASGMGTPRTPPVPLDFDGPYHVGINCVLSPSLCSTSNLHEESKDKRKVPFYGAPCESEIAIGLFSNPHSLKVLKVAGAGCARFWVEIELGNSLFPPFDKGRLDFLNPVIVKQAEREFGMRFVQGCNWG